MPSHVQKHHERPSKMRQEVWDAVRSARSDMKPSEAAILACQLCILVPPPRPKPSHQSDQSDQLTYTVIMYRHPAGFQMYVQKLESTWVRVGCINGQDQFQGPAGFFGSLEQGDYVLAINDESVFSFLPSLRLSTLVKKLTDASLNPIKLTMLRGRLLDKAISGSAADAAESIDDEALANLPRYVVKSHLAAQRQLTMQSSYRHYVLPGFARRPGIRRNGVLFNEEEGSPRQWFAEVIDLNGSVRALGPFLEEFDAAAAFDAYIIRRYGSEASDLVNGMPPKNGSVSEREDEEKADGRDPNLKEGTSTSPQGATPIPVHAIPDSDTPGPSEGKEKEPFPVVNVEEESEGREDGAEIAVTTKRNVKEARKLNREENAHRSTGEKKLEVSGKGTLVKVGEGGEETAKEGRQPKSSPEVDLFQDVTDLQDQVDWEADSEGNNNDDEDFEGDSERSKEYSDDSEEGWEDDSEVDEYVQLPAFSQRMKEQLRAQILAFKYLEKEATVPPKALLAALAGPSDQPPGTADGEAAEGQIVESTQPVLHSQPTFGSKTGQQPKSRAGPSHFKPRRVNRLDEWRENDAEWTPQIRRSKRRKIGWKKKVESSDSSIPSDWLETEDESGGKSSRNEGSRQQGASLKRARGRWSGQHTTFSRVQGIRRKRLRKSGTEDEDEGMSTETQSDAEVPSPHQGQVLIDKFLGVRHMAEDNSKSNGREEYEYLVKWRNKSYRHIEWIDEDTLRRQPRHTQARAKRYVKANLSMLDESDVEARQLYNPMYVEIDRILAEREAEEEEDEAVDREEEDEVYMGTKRKKRQPKIRRGLQYLIKWRGLCYGDITWEWEEEVTDPTKLDEYERFKVPPNLDEAHPAMLKDTRPPPSKFIKYESSPTFSDEKRLKDYQVEGLNWLLTCWYNRRNGILADEMGLGKTIQTIAALDHLYHKEHIRGPFLVVAPVSTLYNWKREIEAWTSMNCVVYHDEGGASGRAVIRKYEFYFDNPLYRQKNVYKFNILLTTYSTVTQDAEELEQIHWRYAVLDEAQKIKTDSTKLREILTTFKFDSCLLLTGTPLQNGVHELWSLLNFIHPTIFRNKEQFIAEHGRLRSADEVVRLQAALRPYLLRRVKDDVERALPVRRETVVDVELTNLQKKYYRAIFERNRDILSNDRAVVQMNLSRIEMALRKCCNHPFLLDGVEEKETRFLPKEEVTDRLVTASGKMVLLLKLLEKFKRENKKALVFSQFTTVLDIIQDVLEDRGFVWERLDGSVSSRKRQQAIDRFNDPQSDSSVFLISTRAGGLGINLTAATVVILFDSDWNPQNDIQAVARCHRIGQTLPVSVYRLVTKGTYEGHIFSIASKKLGLHNALFEAEGMQNELAGDGPGGSMSALLSLDIQKIEKLLRYGAYAALLGQEEDEDAEKRRLRELDIDAILATARSRTYGEDGTVVQEEGFGPSTANSAGGVKIRSLEDAMGDHNHPGLTLSKASFSAESKDLSIDVNDEKFWEKVLGPRTTEKMLARLRGGELYSLTELSMAEYFEVLYELVQPCIKAAKKDHKFKEQDTVVAILRELSSNGKMAYGINHKLLAEAWLDDIENPKRTRSQPKEVERRLLAWIGRKGFVPSSRSPPFHVKKADWEDVGDSSSQDEYLPSSVQSDASTESDVSDLEDEILTDDHADSQEGGRKKKIVISTKSAKATDYSASETAEDTGVPPLNAEQVPDAANIPNGMTSQSSDPPPTRSPTSEVTPRASRKLGAFYDTDTDSDEERAHLVLARLNIQSEAMKKSHGQGTAKAAVAAGLVVAKPSAGEVEGNTPSLFLGLGAPRPVPIHSSRASVIPSHEGSGDMEMEVRTALSPLPPLASKAPDHPTSSYNSFSQTPFGASSAHRNQSKSGGKLSPSPQSRREALHQAQENAQSHSSTFGDLTSPSVGFEAEPSYLEEEREQSDNGASALHQPMQRERETHREGQLNSKKATAKGQKASRSDLTPAASPSKKPELGGFAEQSGHQISSSVIDLSQEDDYVTTRNNMLRLDQQSLTEEERNPDVGSSHKREVAPRGLPTSPGIHLSSTAGQGSVEGSSSAIKKGSKFKRFGSLDSPVPDSSSDVPRNLPKYAGSAPALSSRSPTSFGHENPSKRQPSGKQPTEGNALSRILSSDEGAASEKDSPQPLRAITEEKRGLDTQPIQQEKPRMALNPMEGESVQTPRKPESGTLTEDTASSPSDTLNSPSQKAKLRSKASDSLALPVRTPSRSPATGNQLVHSRLISQEPVVSTSGSFQRVPFSQRLDDAETWSDNIDNGLSDDEGAGHLSLKRYNPNVMPATVTDVDGADDIWCCVCYSGKVYEGDDIVICEGCDVGVHQVPLECHIEYRHHQNAKPLRQDCYGVKEIPEGDKPWFCDLCAAGIQEFPPCRICRKVVFSAMKPVKEGGWAHAACGIWNPEVSFQVPQKMDVVIDVPRISRDRNNLICIFCRSKYGCIQCARCPRAFHTICALNSSRALLIINERDELEPFCFQHQGHAKPKKFEEEDTGQGREHAS